MNKSDISSLPYRQLRKQTLFKELACWSSLPYRQLRNYGVQIPPNIESSLPYRQLRNRFLSNVG